MATRELNFPTIYKDGKLLGYGGNQEWFLDKWQQRAGCGSTSGANLAAYYASVDTKMSGIYEGDSNHFNFIEYLHLMEEMYKQMKPGPLGFPYIKKFAIQFVRYCKKRGLSMESNILKNFCKEEEAFAFVKKNIDVGQPIALLILTHRAEEIRENTWHWVTITGYVETDENFRTSQIIISNYGKREIISADLIFEVHPINRIRMVSFHVKNK